ncbi:hypothetical protein SH580_12640 [Coraliomargarita algicola]|uniref:Cytoskeleton protein RodZ-like C-terminal domain-containing protein n=1 Tax=Coraliomargarita algicola TaxID=3092156 RepID=A0ABZ0RGQ5_9BACT|nr:RodZ domain-containing protein [Coraliomargarita sp. J2-16]WPJ94283.1 hypothetical protein SH580_12640 [Coraliomargarita sp. J2-16]
MKVRRPLLALLAAFAFECYGLPLDAPRVRAPELTASDIAWAEGASYVKGLLPDVEGCRISSVQLDFVYVDGRRRTIVERQVVEVPENRPNAWRGMNGELLIFLQEAQGKTKIFMGVATLERSTHVRALEDFGDSALPGVIRQFAGSTGNTTADLRYTVPVGESEVFQFVDQDGEYYGSLVVVAEGETVKAASGPANRSVTAVVQRAHSLILRATGDVYVLVKTRDTNEEVFRRTLSAGDSVELEVQKTVDLLFTAGEHLIIEWDGEEMKPSTRGTAKISLK